MVTNRRSGVQAAVLLLLVGGCSGDEGSGDGPGSGTGSGGQANGAGGSGMGGSGGQGGGATSSGGRVAGAGGGALGAGGSSAGGGSGTGGAGNTGGAQGPGAGGAGGAGGAQGACGEITTFEAGRTPSRELHVATTGSDQSGDGSSGSPFASIDRAVDDATPGTAIRVHAGTHPGGAYVDGLAGTADAPIWIGGAPGEARPVIEGGGEALHFAQARYVVVHDLEIRGQTANGINADDGNDRANVDASRYLVFRNLFIHDVGGTGNQDCLKLSGINDFFVLGSEMARCGGGASGSAIDHVGCHDGLIARNTFSDLSGGNAVQCKGGSQSLEIRWNRFINAGERAVNMGGSTGFEFFRPPLSTTEPNAEARDIRVIANVIQGAMAALAFVGCVDCLAANNTIVDPGRWVFRILQETGSTAEYTFLESQGGTFVNNLVYFDSSLLSTFVNVGGGTLPGTFSITTNLWYAHDDPGASAPSGLPVVETGGLSGRDPQLTDAGGGDYSLGASSPAEGAGTVIPGVVADITGVCYGAPPSIGAYEGG